MKIVVNTLTPEEIKKGKGLGYPVDQWRGGVEEANRRGYQVLSKEEIYQTADFIVLSTGLYTQGPFKNVDMIDETAVEQMLGNKKLIGLFNVDRWELVSK